MYHDIYALIHEHPFVTTAVLLWIFSAAVSALPEPTPNSAGGYLWLYAFLHALAANLDKFAAAKGIPFATRPAPVVIVTPPAEK